MMPRRLAVLCGHLAPAPTEANVSSEIAEILQKLGPEPLHTVCRKMYYMNLSNLDKSFPKGDLPSMKERGGKDMPELIARIQALAPPPEGEEETDGHLQSAKALLLLGADALDEAHAVSVNVSIRKKFRANGAQRDGTYVHALVHRSEGEFKGAEDVQRVPGGSMGFDSARLILNSFSKPHPLYEKVREKALELAKDSKNEEILGHIRFHEKAWNHTEFLHFCKDMNKSKDPEALTWVGKVMNAEWKILLEHCLEQAKIPVPANASA